MMPGNRVIIISDRLHLHTYSEELMEVDNNNPGFEELGSITLRLLHKFQIQNRDTNTMIVQDVVTISKDLQRLCFEDFTDNCVNRMLHLLELNPHEEESIDICKNAIVLTVVDLAKNTKLKGLKQFRLMVDIELTITREELDLIMMESREQELRWVLLQSMEETNSIKNPASKSSIEKLKRGFFEGGGGEVGDDELVIKKNCAVCLDDFEIGSEVIWMPCSHMFHGGCLDHWFEESNSCPLCRLELTD